MGFTMTCLGSYQRICFDTSVRVTGACRYRDPLFRLPLPLPGTCQGKTQNKFVKSQGIRTGGTKGERRSVTSQAPPLLRQRKPYLTGSPPSRQERRCRQECRVIRV